MSKMAARLCVLISLCWSFSLMAKLPDPTPEEVQKKQADAEKKAKADDTAKAALQKAQQRVAERYRATRKSAPSTTANKKKLSIIGLSV